MTVEDTKDDKSEKIEEDSNNFDDEEYKTCGNESDDHINKLFTSKQAEFPISKTLGKRKRNPHETTTYKKPSILKRTHK